MKLARLVVLTALALSAADRANAKPKSPSYELVPMPWHLASIAGVAVSADGHTAVTGSYDGTLRLWELPALTPRAKLPYDAMADASDPALSADGARLAVIYDKRIHVWDTASGRELRTAPAKGEVKTLAFAPKGRTLLIGGADGAVSEWDVDRASKPSALFATGDRVSALAFTPSGGLVVGGGFEFGHLALWDPASHAKVRDLTLDTDAAPASRSAYIMPVDCLAVSPDGKLAAAGAGREVGLYNLETGHLQRELALEPSEGNYQPGSCTVVFASGGRELVVERLGTVQRFTVSTGARTASIELPRDLNTILHHNAVLLPEIDRVLLGDARGVLALTELSTGKPVVRVGGPASNPTALAFRPGTHMLFAGHGDGSVSVWDGEKARPTGPPRALRKKRLSGIAMAPDGKALAVSAEDGVGIYDSDTLQSLAELSGHEGPVLAIARDGKGARLATGGADRTVRLWDWSGKEIRVLRGHEAEVTGVALSPDGSRVASVSEDGTLRLWDTDAERNPKVAQTSKGRVPFTAVVFSPDGGLLVTAEAFLGDNRVRLFDAASLKELAAMSPSAKSLGALDLEMGRGGRLLYASCLSSQATVFDLKTRSRLASLKGFDGYGFAVAVSDDERFVALGTGTQESAIRIWRLDPSGD